MKFILTQASDWNRKDEIEINSLAELMSLVDEYGSIIIYQQDNYSDPEIKIYDDYVE